MEYSEMVSQVLDYIKGEYGCEPEFLWAKTPGNAAIRHQGNKKWFAALLLAIQRKTLGLGGEGTVDILNVKCDPRMMGSLLDGERYLPGYHMNKEHWLTLLLDGSIPLSDICGLVDVSYGLTCIQRKKK